MKLHELLASPPCVRGAAGGDLDALRQVAGCLPESSPLKRAVARCDPAAPARHGAVGKRAGILDLGPEAGPPGLALGLRAATEEDRGSSARAKDLGGSSARNSLAPSSSTPNSSAPTSSAPNAFAPTLSAPTSSAPNSPRRPRTPAGAPQEVTWIAWGLERPVVNLFLAPALARFGDAVRTAVRNDDADAVLASRDFREAEIVTDVRVAHVLTPLSYRVYRDTPVPEVQNLMLRRRIAAVPVVGDDLEVLGLITAGDLLEHAMSEADGAERGPLAARDVMTRSVYCVSDEESLAEAGRALSARGVAQLPVVREGEIVGFLERAAVMRAFFSPPTEPPK